MIDNHEVVRGGACERAGKSPGASFAEAQQACDACGPGAKRRWPEIALERTSLPEIGAVPRRTAG
jgi:ribosomal protein L37E